MYIQIFVKIVHFAPIHRNCGLYLIIQNARKILKYRTAHWQNGPRFLFFYKFLMATRTKPSLYCVYNAALFSSGVPSCPARPTPRTLRKDIIGFCNSFVVLSLTPAACSIPTRVALLEHVCDLSQRSKENVYNSLGDRGSEL